MCPGAPFLLEGAADALARQVPDLLAACRSAADALRDADVILLLTTSRTAGSPRPAGPPSPASAARVRVLQPGTALGPDGFGRSDRVRKRVRQLPPARPEQDHTAAEPAVGVLVGAGLLTGAGIEVPVTAVEVAGNGSDAAAEMAGSGDLADLVDAAGDRRVGLLVIADGAACHGDSAPGRANEAAAGFERALAAALQSGNPAAVAAACADRDTARNLLATVEPLAAMASITAGHRPQRAHLLYSAAPFGVGYLVGVWQW